MLSQTKRKIIFTSYNRMKREGADKGRLNRALGLAQRTQPRPYTTTADSCDCPDFVYRQSVCKHMLAVRMTTPAAEVAPVAKSGKSLAQINEELFGW